MSRLPNRSDISAGEFSSLREIVAGSFIPTRNIPSERKTRLLQLGLISEAMGGLMPTPAGKMLARR
jgi:hypothetical protein